MNHEDDHDHAHTHGHSHPTHLEDEVATGPAALAEAVISLLVGKGLFDAAEVDRMVADMDARTPAAGARLVARAWVDTAFKERALADVNLAARELGLDTGAIAIRALASTPEVHHLIVCTLCSCYPSGLLGLPPEWYKSRSYRARAVREPRAVLQEFGLELPPGQRIEVHDSTAELRWLVIPIRPAGTEGWDEPSLAKLVSRDSMVGTAVPSVGRG